MKKLLTILLCAALVLSLASCGQKTGVQGPDGSQTGGVQGSGTQDGKNENETPNTPNGDNDPGDAETPDGTETPGDTENPGDTETPGEDEDTGDGQGSPTPGFGGPGFQIGPGGIVTPGGNSGEQEDIPVADAGDLVDQLDALCADIVTGSFCTGLRSSSEFSNYFSGLEYTEGMRVAMNHPEMAPPAHVVMLIEVPEGEDAESFAKNLADNANPRWMICAVADSVQYAVKDDLVLFVMSSEEIANAVIAAFNG